MNTSLFIPHLIEWSGPTGEAWLKLLRSVLIPSPPGYVKSYTELEAEIKAAGLPVPRGLAQLAAEERSPDDCPATSALKWRPKLND